MSMYMEIDFKKMQKSSMDHILLNYSNQQPHTINLSFSIINLQWIIQYFFSDLPHKDDIFPLINNISSSIHQKENPST